jgi:hypothetical protein
LELQPRLRLKPLRVASVFIEEKVFMTQPFRLGIGMIVLVLSGIAARGVLAQGAATPATSSTASRPAPAPAAAGTVARTGSTATAGWTSVDGPFRKLAPGVMREVDLDHRAEATVERHDVTELLYIDPTFDFAKDVAFRHEVWTLEVKYKPLRMIWADIPGRNGRMQRKQIWYIVYQVTNPGNLYRSVQQDDKLYQLVMDKKPVRFTPVFTLETHNLLAKESPGFAKAITEEYVPIVLPAIRTREDKNREFLTSVQMAQREIKVGETLWGVATWQDVDPNNVWFSIYIEGLTNAYKWTDDPAKYSAFRSGASTASFREISTKVLKLNFWRPGDEFTVQEQEVRLGVPELAGGPPPQPTYEWVWWRTFPPSAKAVPPTK